MLIRISYPLETGSPLYPGTPPPLVEPFHTFGDGNASSSSTITFHTHSGTHIDAPLHFCPGGATVADLLGAGRVFSPLEILELPMTGDTCITPAEIEGRLSSLGQTSALLIRTGEWQRRERDPAGYADIHPWLDPGIPDLLREHLPSLQLVGIDAISIASPLHRDEGRACHRSFLCKAPPILILEDLDLSDPLLGGGGCELWVYPWFRQGLDGIPVVAIVGKKSS
jgi:kynurenine formamidase